MKREGFIYEKICDIDNIKEAIKEVSKRKTKRKNVKYILDNIEEKAKEIQELLINENYIPSPYKIFILKEGINKKEREIRAPKFFPDQIIHRLLIKQIEYILIRGMYKFSCASIKNRGVHYGKKYLEKWLRKDKKNTKYCLKLDIQKFFPSVNNFIMKELFTYKIKDKKVLNLINIIIDSCEKGLPIGNYTSQWFANFYLEKLDHFIKQNLQAIYYMRYMDDIVILGNNKRKLHKIRKSIEDFLEFFSLKIKSNWQVFRIDDRGLDFLGFRFYHFKTIIRKKLMFRISNTNNKFNKFKSLNHSYSLVSYFGWLRHSDSGIFIKRFINYNNIKEAKHIISNCAKLSYI